MEYAEKLRLEARQARMILDQFARQRTIMDQDVIELLEEVDFALIAEALDRLADLTE